MFVVQLFLYPYKVPPVSSACEHAFDSDEGFRTPEEFIGHHSIPGP